MLKDSKILKIRFNAYTNGIMISNRILYYPNLKSRTLGRFIVLDLQQNQLIPPNIPARRINRDRDKLVSQMKVSIDKLIRLRDSLNYRMISKEECAVQLEQLIPHGFRWQNEVFASRIIEQDLNTIQLSVSGQRYVGGIDTATNITIFRRIPASATKIREILVNTVNGINKKSVYRFSAAVGKNELSLDALEGDIPTDFYLSPADAEKFGIFVKGIRKEEIS